jgi:predicted nucleic acid-binding protein
MQAVLIDTDIAVDYLRGAPDTKNLILPLWDNDAAYLSILSVYELYAGMKENEKEDTENFVQACNVEPVTIEIAEKAGELYRKFRSQGITLTSLDCLINASAIIKGHKIATRNKDHYPNKEVLLMKAPHKKE